MTAVTGLLAGQRQLTTIVDIRDWLLEQVHISRQSVNSLEQFAIDWIEEEADRAVRYLESEGITVDDVTFTGATHYRADCVLEVLRPDTNCHAFFTKLVRLTK